MKKQRRKSSPSKRRKGASQPAAPASDGRRRALGFLGKGALGVAVIGAGGYFTNRAYCATATEHDLTRVGQGTPSIVQIHDPQCGLCRHLQRNTRAALDSFDEGQIDYVIANIRTDEGSSFALRHGAGHVTLLLFDGDGRLRDTVQGVTPRDELEQIFARHLAR